MIVPCARCRTPLDVSLPPGVSGTFFLGPSWCPTCKIAHDAELAAQPQWAEVTADRIIAESLASGTIDLARLRELIVNVIGENE